MENGFTGVDDKAVAAGLGHDVDKIGHIFVAIQVINANAVLHGDRQCGSLAHGLDATRHQRRLRHQASAKMAVLDAVAGAANIEIHFVIAPVFSQPSTRSQMCRIIAAQLQYQGFFYL